MKISAYHFYLLYNGGNPANKLSGFNNRNIHYSCGRPNLWAAEFITDLIKKDAVAFASEHHIGAWAAVESLNCGSLQRSSLHETVWSSLKGSGRWLASDGGGHFKILLDKTIEWLLLEERYKKPWRALALTVEVWPNDLEQYALKTRKYRELTADFNASEEIAFASCWCVRVHRQTNNVYVKVWAENNPDNEVVIETSIYKHIEYVDLYSKYGIDFETLDEISDYLDNNNSELEIETHCRWEDGPWYFKFRSSN